MPKEQFRSNLRSSRHGGPLIALIWVSEQLLVRPVVTIGLMKRSFQQAFTSPLGVWTGTGLVVAAVATVFINGSAVLQALHSPLVTKEH